MEAEENKEQQITVKSFDSTEQQHAAFKVSLLLIHICKRK
jgi:hypothetical protein